MVAAPAATLPIAPMPSLLVVTFHTRAFNYYASKDTDELQYYAAMLLSHFLLDPNNVQNNTRPDRLRQLIAGKMSQFNGGKVCVYLYPQCFDQPITSGAPHLQHSFTLKRCILCCYVRPLFSASTLSQC